MPQPSSPRTILYDQSHQQLVAQSQYFAVRSAIAFQGRTMASKNAPAAHQQHLAVFIDAISKRTTYDYI